MRSVSTLALSLWGLAVIQPNSANAEDITNSSTIVGQTGTQPSGTTAWLNGTPGNPGGDGASVSSAQTYTNTSLGNITGGKGSIGGTARYSGSGGQGGSGVLISGQGSTLINAGSIAGGQGGNGGNYSVGAGGYGSGGNGVSITGTGNTLINSGTISGNHGGVGNSNGTNIFSNSVNVTGTNNTVELDVGGSFANNVVSTVTGNTFALGGKGTSTFDFSNSSSKVTGFSYLKVTGSSDWTILGTNTTSVDVTIDPTATLELGNGGTSGLIASGQAIHNSGTLVVNHSDTVVLNQTIDGTGTFVQAGNGTTRLTTAQKYTGATSITGGTLALTGDGSIAASSGVHANSVFDLSATTNTAPNITALDGTGSIILGANTLNLTNANSGFGNVFSGVASGTGGLAVGAGTEILAGDNTYTGATTVNQGATLQLGNGGTGGRISTSSAIHNNGALVVDHSDAVALTQGIDGTGSLTQQGQGTTTLSAANSYTGATTITAGTLALSGDGSIATSSGVHDNGVFDVSGSSSTTPSIAALEGAGSVVLGAHTLTLTNANSSFGNVFSGVASGTGGLTVAGGTETLSGANTYTGVTTVAQGAGLNLPGSIAGDLTTAGTTSISGGSVGGSTSNSGTLTASDATLHDLSNTAGTATLTDSTANTLANAANATLNVVRGQIAGTTTNNGTFTAQNATLHDVSNTGGTATLTSTTAGALTNADGATLSMSGGSATSATNAGTMNLSGGNTVSGDVTNTAGQVTLDGATVGGTLAAQGGNFTVGSNAATANSLSGSGNGTLEGTLNLTDAADTYSGILSGTGGLSVNGGTETLSGANTYTGVTTVAQGAGLNLPGSIAGDLTTAGTTTIAGGSVGGSTSNSGTLTASNATLHDLSNTAGTATLTDSTANMLANATNATLNVVRSQIAGTTTNNGTLTAQNATLHDLSNTAGTATLTNATAGALINADGATLSLSGGSATSATNAGTMSLSGGNSVSGDVTNTAGQLTLDGATVGGTLAAQGGSFTVGANAATAGSLSGTANGTLDGTLSLSKAADTYSGILSGAGGLSVNGGSEVLSGDNTYTGATTIATGGTLQLGDGGTTGSISSSTAVHNDGQLIVKHSNDLTIAQAMDGSGSFTQAGTGTTTLSGANTYTGVTTVAQGSGLNLPGSIAGDLTTAGATAITGGSVGGNTSNSGTLTASNATLRDLSNTGGTATLTNTTAGALTNADGATLSMSGGSATSATNAGTMSLSGGNSVSGDVTNTAGQLTLDGATVGGTLAAQGGSFTVGSNAATAGSLSGSADGTLDGSLSLSNAADTYSGILSGTGGLSVNGGTETLSGANTYTGVTTVAQGAGLNLPGSIAGDLTTAGTTSIAGGSVGGSTSNSGTLTASNATLHDLSNTAGTATLTDSTADTLANAANATLNVVRGQITGTTTNNGTFTAQNATLHDVSNTGGTVTLTNTTAGALTNADGATLSVSGGSATSATNAGTMSLSGGNSISGDVTNTAGQVTLDGATVGGTLAAQGGSFTVGSNAATAGSLSGTANGTLDGTLSLRNAADTYSGILSGAGGLSVNGGSEVLSGENSYTGATTIATGGTLQLGDGGTSGSISSSAAVHNDGQLSVKHSNDLTIVQAMDGSGSFTQAGTGTTVLTGANSYSGTTTVSAGTLQVDGNQSAATGATEVASGASLAGIGTLGGNVTLADGATLTPGDANHTVGTLTINGNLIQNKNSLQNWELGEANTPGGQYNSLVAVKGDLTLGGTLNVSTVNGGPDVQNGSLDAGVYRLYTYGGTLSGASNQALGSVPNNSNTTLGLQTSIDHQVNLILSDGTINFWDGGATINHGAGDTGGDGTVNGGDGIWTALNGVGDNNWTNAEGSRNTPWGAGAMAIFEGSAGRVEVQDTDASGAFSPVKVSGIQFANNDGQTYVVTGDDLYVTTATTTIRVGDGSSSGASITATLDTVLNDSTVAGGTALVKSDAGRLIITKDQTYTGATTLSGGTLQLGNGGTGGRISTSSAIHNNGALVVDHSDAVALTQGIDGTGSLTQQGQGTTTLSAANSYTGATTITAGTLALSGDGSIATSFGVHDNGVFDVSGTSSTTPSIAALEGPGSVVLGANTLTLTNANSSFGNVFSGVASGTGGLSVNGGTETLSGANTYTGVTTVAQGAGLNLPGSIAGNLTTAGTTTIAGGNVGGSTSNSGTLTASNATLHDLSNTAGTATLTNTTAGALTNADGATLSLSGGSATSATNAGTMSLSGGNSVSGDVTNTAGQVTLDGAKVGGTLAAQGGSFTVGANAATAGSLSGTANGMLDGTLSLSNAADTYSGILSGTGGLSVNGGSEVLSGDNTYTGATTIATGGTLQLGDGGTTGSISSSAAVHNDGELIVKHSNDLTIAQAMDGSGSFTQAGTGTTTLSGANTYTGVTTVAQGSGLNLPGSIAGNLTTAGTTTIAGGSVGGSTSNSGTLTASNATLHDLSNTGGTATLTNTTAGALTNADGATLSMSDGSATFATNAGTMSLSGGNSVSGDVTNTAGQLMLDGATVGGTLAAQGGSFTVGSNAATTGSLSGSADGTLDGSLSLSNAADTYSGILSGTGGLSVNGGTETLSGANTYTGVTTVAQGAGLNLPGSIAGDLTTAGTTTIAGGSVGGSTSNSGTLTASNATLRDLSNTGGTATLTNTTAGALTNADGATLSLNGGSATSATNAGTMSLRGGNTVSGDVTNTAGQVTLDGATVGGTLAAQGGSFTVGSNAATAGSLSGAADGTLDGSLSLSNAADTYSGILSGTGGLSVNGGTETLSGANTYTGVTTVAQGAGLNLPGSIAGDLTTAGTTSIAGGSVGGSTSNSGTLTASNATLHDLSNTAGMATLTNTTAGALTNADGATLSLSGGSATSATNEGTMSLSGGNSVSGDVTNTAGQVTLDGATVGGTLAAQGGRFTVGANAATAGSLSGTANGTLDGTLSLSKAADTYSGVLSGAGSLVINGGTQVLSGDNSYRGTTEVNAGTLQIDGNQSAAAGATRVASGATLAGHGTVGGDVSIKEGGILSPGQSLQNAGTLTIGGNLSLDKGSIQNWNLGEANIAGGQYNDLVDVKGNLALGGTLNVSTQNGGPDVVDGVLDAGIYRLYTYGGSLSGVSGQKLGNIAQGTNTLSLQTVIDHQVNLVVGSNTMNFWDGGNSNNHGADGSSGNATVNGGNGVWTALNGAGDNNWTNANGSRNTPWNTGSYAIFEGSAGRVEVQDTDASGAFSPVKVSGMQFANNDGQTYVVTGDDLYVTTATTTIRVGDGSSSGASITATLDTVLNDSTVAGGTALVKSDAGTLIITKDQTYTGATTLSGGTLQLGNGGTGGRISSSSAIHNNGALVVDHSDAVVLTQGIDGAGNLTQQGQGTTTLSAANSYTGATTITAGTLALSGDGSIATSSGVHDKGVFDVSGSSSTTPSIAALEGAGSVILGANTLTLTNANNNFGNVFSGVASGTGGLSVNGGTETLSGANTYTGVTTVVQGAGLNLPGSIAGNLTTAGTTSIAGGSVGGSTSNSGTLTASNATLHDLANTGGTATLTNTTAGALTNADGATLRVSGGSATSATNAGTMSLSGGNSVSGDVTNTAGQVTLDGATVGGTLAAQGGRFTVGANAATAGSLSGTANGMLDGTLSLSNAADTYSGILSGTGGLSVNGGSEVLSGDNTYTGATTIATGGTLQLGDGGTTGSISSSAAVHNDGELIVKHSNDLTIAQAMDGRGSFTQAGTGTTVLTGANSYSGTTTVSAGTLQVDGNQSGATGATEVASGASLAGIGTLGGNVTLADGATLTPGGINHAVGTLTVNGNLSLGKNSIQNWDLGQVNIAGGQYNDFVDVKGNLTLGGTLNVAAVTGGPDVKNGLLDAGVYRLYAYDGKLSGALDEKLGDIPQGDNVSLGLQTSIAHQVNLVVSDGTLIYWDGGNSANHGTDGASGNGEVNGGDGVWTTLNGVGDGNWTNYNGTRNAPWDPGGFAIFNATAGTVTVSDTNKAGNVANVTIKGMQFANSDGNMYVVTGDDVYATTNTTTIRVGDGTNEGSTIIADLDTVINDSQVSGGTSLVKSDAGTLLITKDQTYVGDTTISGGTLQLGNGGTEGRIDSSAAIHNDGALVIDHSDAVTLTQQIDGLGSLTQQGKGTTVLGNTNSYAGGTNITDGTLQGSASSFGSGAIVNEGTLVLNQDKDGSLDNPLSGKGNFIKNGNALVAINHDDSQFEGKTTVSAGTLNVNGSLENSQISVAEGATLSGLGKVGATHIAQGGILAPGNADTVGALTIKGDLNMQAGSVLSGTGTGTLTGTTFTANGATYAQLLGDVVRVAGAANINGASVSFNVVQGSVLKANQAYTVLSATGGINGKYLDLLTNITKNYLFLTPQLFYTADDVDLLLINNGLNISELGGSGNQRQVEQGLSGMSVENPIIKAISQLDKQDGLQAINALSGEGHASVATAMTEDAFFARDAMNERLETAECDGGYNRGTQSTASLHNKVFEKNNRCYTDRFTLWGQSYGSLGENYGDGNAATMHHTTAGFMVGADTAVHDRWRVGGLLGYGSSTFNVGTGRNSHGNSNNVVLGGYAGTHWGKLNLRMGASYAWNMQQVNRTVAFKGYQDGRLNSSYLGGTAQAFGEVGYKIRHNGTVIEPFAQVAYVNTHTNKYHETGGIEALNGRAMDMGVTFSSFGVRAASTFKMGNLAMTPQALLGYRHAFGHLAPTVRQTFASEGNGPMMSISGTPLAADSAVLNAGFTIQATDRIDFGLSYIGQYAVQALDNGARAHVKITF
nr:autotransporter-associated beta strand repeat-containing protein [Acetobacter orientalis]